MCKTCMDIYTVQCWETHAFLIHRDTFKLFLETCLVSYPVCYSFLAVGPKDTPMNLVLEKTCNAKTGRGMPEL